MHVCVLQLIAFLSVCLCIETGGLFKLGVDLLQLFSENTA